MSDPIARRVLDALFESDHALNAYYSEPDQDPEIDRSVVRVLATQKEDANPLGVLVRVTALEVRAYDEGLTAPPAEGCRFSVFPDAPEFAGAEFMLIGDAMRLDRARLVWTCPVQEFGS